jgi:asparagine synthase (glutamine-hydrolysing)
VDVHGARPHRLALGFRRFSIVDPSPAGHQPFWTPGREVCLTVNGELYNYVEIRDELRALGREFTTSCDTEVMAVAYLEWGERCFERFNGFWALALYDANKSALMLARDRIGKAPLYVLRHPEGLFWASEIKALQAAVGSSFLEVSDQAVSDFILHGYRDVRHRTFYTNVETFPNASYAWIEADQAPAPRAYWALPTKRAAAGELDGDAAALELERLLVDALRVRMRADVPVGFELSGGMDSSALVATAASHFDKPMEVFTVSWPGSVEDEEVFARAVAERYPESIHYNVLTPPADELFEQADSFIWLMEQPFRTPAVLTYQGILRAMGERGMRVSINGTGGDENFAGYGMYRRPYLRHLLGRGRLLACLAESRPCGTTADRPSAADYLFNSARLGVRGLQQLGSKIRGRGSNDSSTRRALELAFRQPNGIAASDGPSREINALLLDTMGPWLMSYWQRVVNQASMGVPVEVRSPLLDHRIVDFVFRLPLDLILRNGWTKWLLRRSVRDILPPSVVWRKQKRGFPFPHGEWAAAHKEVFFATIGPIDCPYLDQAGLRSSYSELCVLEPELLWRIMSVALWWKRCIQGDSLGSLA